MIVVSTLIGLGRVLINSCFAGGAIDGTNNERHMKSDIWAYEDEWRVWSLADKTDPPHFTDWPIFSNEIEAIYLGCKIEPDKKREIQKLLSSKHPNVKVFESRKVRDEYKIEFDEMQNK
jgi:hypothetical protein